MSNFIGTRPDQIPTNADLGKLAYQDSVHNISGNAATVTNGVYTTGNQTIGGEKTFTGTVALSSLNIATNTTPAVFTKDDNLTAWDYSGKSFSVNSQETVSSGIFFKPDGLAMYVVGSTGDDVNQYSLSTAWDVTTASFVQVSAAIGETGPAGVFFKPDGTAMYVTGSTNDSVREFSLSNAWDVSTITFVHEFSIATEETVPSDLWFKPDGTKMYVIGSSGDDVNEYNLSTAWNVSTAVFVQSFSVAAQDSAPSSVVFSPDGTKMYVLGVTGQDINRYTLSTPWDVSTAVFFNNFYIGFQETSPSGLFINFDSDTAYVVGSSADTVFQYNTLTDGIELMSSSGLFVQGSLYTNKNLLVTAGSRIDGTLSVALATTLASTLTVGGTATLNGAVTMPTTTGAITIGTSQSTGTTTIGGTAQTGLITVGRSTGTQTLDLAAGATTAVATKTVNIGTAGVSGSTTNINIGSQVSGATSNLVLNGTTTIAGNLVVNGTTTTINATTLTVNDKNIEIGSVAAPTDTTADGGGITLKGTTDKTILWNTSSDAWNFNKPIKLDVGSGTAPLVVESTTRVANLNVATAGNADTVTNGVYTTGDQAIGGIKTFTSSTNFIATGNQLLIKNGTANDSTVIHRKDGNDYYILLSNASTTPNVTWNTLRPFVINQTTGLLTSQNGQAFSGGTVISGILSTSAGSYLGIGTASPTTAVHVLGTGGASSRVTIESTSSTGALTPQLIFNRTTTADVLEFVGNIQFTRLLTNGVANTAASILVSGVNTAASPTASLISDVITSHSWRVGGTERVTLTDSVFNSTVAITQAGNQVLHAGNFTTYSPPLTGTGASGTWGISITGSAATLTTGRTIALTGDVTYTSAAFDGSANVTATATLATVNSNVGTFGSSTQIPSITVNNKGLVTAISTTAVSIPSGAISVTGGDLTLSGTTGADITNAALAAVGTAGTYTKVTTDSKGRVTSGTTLSATDIPAFSQNIADGIIPTLFKAGRDETQYVSFYGNSSGNRLISVTSSTNPKEFAIRVTDTVLTAQFNFFRSGLLSATSFSGALNGTVGATTPSTGAFTTLTTSGSAIISVADNTNAALRITQTGTGNALLVEDSTNPDSSPFVIDTDGNAVFGNTTTFEITSAQTGTAAATRLQYATIAGANNSTFAIGNFSTTGTSVSPVVAFAKSKSGTIGTQAILANGDRIGLLDFQGSDGTQFVRAARIEAHVDGIPGQTAGTFTVGLSYIILSTGTTDFTLIGAASNTVGVTFTATDIGTGTGTAILATGDMPGRLTFSTTAAGASLPTEHVRITSAGKTGFATTVPAATVHVAGDTILSNVNVLGATYDNVFFSVAAQEGTPQDVFFSPDGTHMYIIGSSGDDINEYELSTPWLISSAVFVTSIVVGQAETSPVGFFFRADGKKLYVIGQATDNVFQYTLSAPWNIATLSYDSVFFSVLAQESAPTSVSFKPDGLSMYILGATTSDSVYQYTLSTAWDVSTAVFLQSFNVTSQETLPAGLAFTDDGTRMFVCGTTGDDVNVYNLTTPWNVSTAQFVSSLSVAGQETAPNGVYIKPDGTKMYVVGSTTDTVYQYTVPSINIQLTGPVSAGSLAVQQDLNVYGNSSSYSASFTSYTEGTFVVTGTVPKLSPTHGTIQTWTLTANSTPTAGTWANGQSLTLMIDDGTARTINWTSIGVTWKTSGGIAPLLNTTGFTVIQLWKVGDVIYGARVGDA